MTTYQVLNGLEKIKAISEVVFFVTRNVLINNDFGYYSCFVYRVILMIYWRVHFRQYSIITGKFYKADKCISSLPNISSSLRPVCPWEPMYAIEYVISAELSEELLVKLKTR